ncbi:hypothetical protein AVDCRST_MAG92-2914 [uncultured Coleofasciculus sp.]|uniref:Uncharacterized protein n=1 Tax=uncultured Coleofasciculus sp. TaxID=1267456 RepID=A0A6J4J7R1_9CYAN|nr:hypothetical protein AVDCRST_MAG92-2914 [uncultured Coleofasciculus sp.]
MAICAWLYSLRDRIGLNAHSALIIKLHDLDRIGAKRENRS